MIEQDHVYKVYDRIAHSFSATRCDVWPAVSSYVDKIRKNSHVLDVGSGNGKNQYRSDIVWQTFDMCKEFCKMTQDCVMGNALKLPFRSNVFDNVMCIACIHHLATKKRRQQAIDECMRVLKHGGTCMISVWANHGDRNGDALVSWQSTGLERFYHFSSNEELVTLTASYNTRIYKDNHRAPNKKQRKNNLPVNWFIEISH